MAQVRQDLTQYGDGELSMHVFNDKGLYNLRHNGNLEAFLREMFIFTDEQLEELVTDIRIDEREEIEGLELLDD